MELTEDKIIQNTWKTLWPLPQKYSPTLSKRIYLCIMWIQRKQTKAWVL